MIYACLIYEDHGQSLDLILKKDELLPLPPRHVRCIIWQIFLGVKCETHIRLILAKLEVS